MLQNFWRICATDAMQFIPRLFNVYSNDHVTTVLYTVYYEVNYVPVPGSHPNKPQYRSYASICLFCMSSYLEN